MLTPDPTLFRLNLFGQCLHVTAWTLFGLIMGNGLFTARVVAQWVMSERQGRSVTPRSFWWLSLIATLAMIVYGFQRMEIPFILGFAINVVPYARNLVLSYRPTRGAGPLALTLCVAAVLGCVALLVTQRDAAIKDTWFYFGLAGSLVFNSRFLIQWVQSERSGRSELSLTFWYVSLVGSVTLLIYSFKRLDLVFILGLLFTSIPYVRNIVLIRRAAAEMPGIGAGSPPSP